MLRIAMTSLALGTFSATYVLTQYLIGNDVNVGVLCLASACAGAAGSALVACVKEKVRETREWSMNGVPSTWYEDKRDWR